MTFFAICFRLVPFASGLVTVALTGCAAFDPVAQSKVENLHAHSYVAILPCGFDGEITTTRLGHTAALGVSHLPRSNPACELIANKVGGTKTPGRSSSLWAKWKENSGGPTQIE